MKTERKSIHKLAPIEGVNLTDKTVKLFNSWFIAGLDPDKLTFKCTGGSGCDPHAGGRAVFGTFSDGEAARINRGDIEGIVE